MIDLSLLKPGLAGRAEILVGDEHTAPRIGRGRANLLATSTVINVLQVASLDAVERLLPKDYQSIGIGLSVRHYAATPVGMKLIATAKLIKVDGRTLHFRVEAHDEIECVVEGSHVRVVINVGRFEEKLRNKTRCHQKENFTTPLRNREEIWRLTDKSLA